MRTAAHTILTYVCLILLFCSCGKENSKNNTVDPDPVTSKEGKLLIKPFGQPESRTIAANAPDTEITISQGLVKGLKISVPSMAFASTETIKLSEAEIVSHEYSADYKQLSPLIKIESGNGNLENGIKISIPISLPEGHAASAFAVGADGSLHILPVLNLQNNRIDIMLFNLNYVDALIPSGRVSQTYADQGLIKFVVFAISESKLTEDVSSTYTPGVDDWEFENYGSSVAANGMCFGMTVSSLWYNQYEKYRAGKLFGRADLGMSVQSNGQSINDTYVTGHNKDALWFDNSSGIKLASDIQVKQNATVATKIIRYFQWFQELPLSKVVRDRYMYYQIAFHFSMSKEPLLLWLKKESAHVILVVGKTKNSILVSDPNKPGVLGVIPFSSSGFGTYNSGLNSTAQSVYEDFYMVPWRGTIKVNQLTQAWQNLQNGSVGNDILPRVASSIVQNGVEIQLLPSQINKIQQTFTFPASGNAAIFETSGKRIIPDNQKKVTLKQGNIKIGIYTSQSVNGAAKWRDFQWYDLEVSPDDKPVTTNITGYIRVSVKNPSDLKITLDQGTFELLDSGPLRWYFKFIVPAGETKLTIVNPMNDPFDQATNSSDVWVTGESPKFDACIYPVGKTASDCKSLASIGRDGQQFTIIAKTR